MSDLFVLTYTHADRPSHTYMSTYTHTHTYTHIIHWLYAQYLNTNRKVNNGAFALHKKLALAIYVQKHTHIQTHTHTHADKQTNTREQS
jgi:hypothetical protein